MSQKLTDDLKIKIRDEFIHGYTDEDGIRRFPTVDGLVRRHSVARATLYKAAKDDEWQTKKDRYHTELEARQEKERMDMMVREAKRLDDSSIQIAQAMLVSVGRQLQKSISEDAKQLTSGELQQLSAAACNAQKIGKLALGQAQEISKVAADVSNPEAFQHIMEQLDGLAAARSQGDIGSVH